MINSNFFQPDDTVSVTCLIEKEISFFNPKNEIEVLDHAVQNKDIFAEFSHLMIPSLESTFAIESKFPELHEVLKSVEDVDKCRIVLIDYIKHLYPGQVTPQINIYKVAGNIFKVHVHVEIKHKVRDIKHFSTDIFNMCNFIVHTEYGDMQFLRKGKK
tara:strand:+ start:183 stop:656 length:474 start_codon:yes stop_codon:yes gene_type:complete